jgi:hypothetical protein
MITVIQQRIIVRNIVSFEYLVLLDIIVQDEVAHIDGIKLTSGVIRTIIEGWKIIVKEIFLTFLQVLIHSLYL